MYNTTISLDGLCETPDEVPGCTNASACNYDPNATANDGSCEYDSCAGCTDELACNFDITATNDDGSCEFTSCQCLGDLDGDGQISVIDVLMFLSDFGCTIAPCVGDVNGDEQTNVSDLLILLSQFGEVCE